MVSNESMSREASTSRLFPNEPFDWEKRWQVGAYAVENYLTDLTASALTEVGMHPHVEYRADKETDILWWDGQLDDTAWKKVDKAHELARLRDGY
jgi:hypothetical protein